MTDWLKNDYGLLLPGSTGNGVEGGNRSIHGAERWSAVVQAVATALAVLVAVPGVWIGLNTLREQQKLNREQFVVFSMQQESYQRRYASRVSWIHELVITKAGMVTRLTIRNGSSAPINSVVASIRPAGFPVDSGTVGIGDVDSCTKVVLDLPTIGDNTRYATRLYFSDSVASWVKDNQGAADRVDRIPLNYLYTNDAGTATILEKRERPLQLAVKETELAGCGEG